MATNPLAGNSLCEELSLSLSTHSFANDLRYEVLTPSNDGAVLLMASGVPRPERMPCGYRIFNPVLQSRKFDPDGNLYPPLFPSSQPHIGFMSHTLCPLANRVGMVVKSELITLPLSWIIGRHVRNT